MNPSNLACSNDSRDVAPLFLIVFCLFVFSSFFQMSRTSRKFAAFLFFLGTCRKCRGNYGISEIIGARTCRSPVWKSFIRSEFETRITRNHFWEAVVRQLAVFHDYGSLSYHKYGNSRKSNLGKPASWYDVFVTLLVTFFHHGGSRLDVSTLCVKVSIEHSERWR